MKRESEAGRPLELPRVNPVGIVELPAGYRARPRKISPVLRAGVFLVLAIFFLTAMVTTVTSLGAYCLTTDGGNVRNLPTAPPPASAVPPRPLPSL